MPTEQAFTNTDGTFDTEWASDLYCPRCGGKVVIETPTEDKEFERLIDRLSNDEQFLSDYVKSVRKEISRLDSDLTALREVVNEYADAKKAFDDAKDALKKMPIALSYSGGKEAYLKASAKAQDSAKRFELARSALMNSRWTVTEGGE